jgi:hypothetical protein
MGHDDIGHQQIHVALVERLHLEGFAAIACLQNGVTMALEHQADHSAHRGSKPLSTTIGVPPAPARTWKNVSSPWQSGRERSSITVKSVPRDLVVDDLWSFAKGTWRWTLEERTVGSYVFGIIQTLSPSVSLSPGQRSSDHNELNCARLVGETIPALQSGRQSVALLEKPAYPPRFPTGQSLKKALRTWDLIQNFTIFLWLSIFKSEAQCRDTVHPL